MDPLTWHHLGKIRQRDLLDAAYDEPAPVLRPLLARFGKLMIAAGEKIVAAAEPALADMVCLDGELPETETC